MTSAAAPAAPPPPPADAAAVFGDRLDLARAYAGILCTDGVLRGVIGPREAARIWQRHLLNSAALATLVPPHAVVVDLGSGAGLPGIPLALARPDLHVTLVEPLARRVAFLRDALAQLPLSLEVVCERAEQLAPESADVLVARAVAPLPRLATLALPVLRPGGRLLALKGRTADAEIRSSTGVLRKWRATATAVSVHAGDEAATVVQIVRPTAQRGTPQRRSSA